MTLEAAVFSRSSSMLNYDLDIQALRPFHEFNLHGYLIFDCETSK